MMRSADRAGEICASRPGLGFWLPIAFSSDSSFGAVFARPAVGCTAIEADVTEAIELRPGLTPLADWRAIYRGAPVTLDPVARADVEAGRAALAEILSQNGLPPPKDIAGASPSVAELVEKRGEPLPSGLLRLFVALKLASLAQGMSGVRWSVIEAIAAFLAHDLLPVVAAENASDRIALARLFGALTGTGEVLRKGKVRSAQKALEEGRSRSAEAQSARARRASLRHTAFAGDRACGAVRGRASPSVGDRRGRSLGGGASLRAAAPECLPAASATGADRSRCGVPPASRTGCSASFGSDK